MTSRMEIPVTTLADGSALIPIIPNSCIYGTGFLTSRLPFVQVCGNSTLPYSVPGLFSPPGPFQNQNTSFVTYAVDACMFDFIETESPLTVKGKL